MSIDNGKTPDANSILRENGNDALRGAIENSEDPFADGSADLQPNVAEQVIPYGADRTGAAEEPAWPVMGEAAYHGFAGDVVKTIEPHTEADPVALLLQLLACFGSSVGRDRYFQVESDRHHANLFAVLVGNTSKARKGTSFGRIRELMQVADPTWASNCVQGGLSSGEGLIHAVRDPVEKMDKETGELVVTDPGVRDKRLLVVENEFAAVMAVMERAQNTISHLIRKAWDTGDLQTMTRNSPLRATGAHVSIVAHITVDELRARLTRTDVANGFANRFLFGMVRRSRELPFGGDLSDSEMNHLGEQLRAIIGCAAVDWQGGVPSRLAMTDAAREEWARCYHDLSASRPGLLGAITARAEAQTMRLALIYALLDRSSQIDLPHLLAGRAVWDFCDASAACIFGSSLGDQIADDIMRALAVAGADGMSRNDIYNLFGRNKDGARIGAALALLHLHGRARMAKRTTGGRPAEVWFAV